MKHYESEEFLSIFGMSSTPSWRRFWPHSLACGEIFDGGIDTRVIMTQIGDIKEW